VVLLHLDTGTGEIWEPQIAALAKAGFRAIAFDRQGGERAPRIRPPVRSPVTSPTIT
jgi:hypothetical protein